MKKFLLPLSFLLFPVAAALIASVFNNIFITIGAVAASLVILAFILRADVFMLIGSHLYLKDHTKGLIWMKRALDTGKLRPKSRLTYAYLLLRNGELDDAESLINKTTYLGRNILTPADIKSADFNLALISWKRGNLNDAIMKMEELYADGYITSAIYGSLGYFYIANNETEKAIEFSKEGLEYDQNDLITMDNLGQAYIITGMLDDAQQIYNKIFESNPAFMEPFYNYGTLLEKYGELTQAKEMYQKALNYEEKYLSTITHEAINNAISRIDDILNTDVNL